MLNTKLIKLRKQLRPTKDPTREVPVEIQQLSPGMIFRDGYYGRSQVIRKIKNKGTGWNGHGYGIWYRTLPTIDNVPSEVRWVYGTHVVYL
jgi:hypothetical protein